MNEERQRAGLEIYANPRNAAAGAVRMMDPREVARRPLRVVFYQAVEGPSVAKTHSETLEWLAAQGVTHIGVDVQNVHWKPVYEALKERFVFVLIDAEQPCDGVPASARGAQPSVRIATMLESDPQRRDFVPLTPVRELLI